MSLGDRAEAPENISVGFRPKRGRPQKTYNRHRLGRVLGGGRNRADLVAAWLRLDPRHRDEWLRLADAKQIHGTTLAYLARLPVEDQAVFLSTFRKQGARWAKRFVECLTQPPSHATIAERLLVFARREFPSLVVEADDLAAAFRLAAETLEGRR